MKLTPDPRTILVWRDGDLHQRYICACGDEDKPFNAKNEAIHHNNSKHGGKYKVVDRVNASS